MLEQVLSSQAAKCDIILFKQICLGKRVCILEVMADIQPYCFEPECGPNPEDSDQRKTKK